MIFRALQGIGGATIFATSLALLAQPSTGASAGWRSGPGAPWSPWRARGPVLGGLLATELSWRPIFFVNLPFGIIAIIVTLIGVQEFRPPHSRRIDIPGFALFTLGLVALVYGLIESGRPGWGSTRVIVSLAAAAASLGTFPILERARREPMFDLALLRKPTFVGGLVGAFGMNGSLYAMLLELVIYLQDGLHESALGAGARLVVITAGSMISI